jgi:hypothetical protein
MHFLRKGKLLTVQVTSKRSRCFSSNYSVYNEAYSSVDGCNQLCPSSRGFGGSGRGGVTAGQRVSLLAPMQNLPRIMLHLTTTFSCHDQATTHPLKGTPLQAHQSQSAVSWAGVRGGREGGLGGRGEPHVKMKNLC